MKDAVNPVQLLLRLLKKLDFRAVPHDEVIVGHPLAPLQVDLLASKHAVDRANLVATGEQCLAKMASKETRSAGHDAAHGPRRRPLSITNGARTGQD